MMQKYEMTMISQVIADVAVSVRCSCPILVQLRWVVELLYLNLMNVALWDDKAIHARCLNVATYDLVDYHGDDAMSDLMVVAVLFLDVEVDVLLEWSPRLVFDKVVDKEVDVEKCLIMKIDQEGFNRASELEKEFQPLFNTI